MRILVNPNQPEVHFICTPYDMGTNYHSIQDFLFLMEWTKDHTLRNEVLVLNGIANVVLESPNPFQNNTILKMLFHSKEAMMAYLNNEPPSPEKKAQFDSLVGRLKEFFNDRDKEIAAEVSIG